MKDKFQNKYRITTSRLQSWDYGWNGLYFVTICTKNRVCYFGDIKNGKMILSGIGQMAEQCWLEIPLHFPFVILHNHIVMPNHAHGIIEIAKTNDNMGVVNVQNVINVEAQNFVPQHLSPHAPPPQSQPSEPKNKFGPQSKNLASIIRGFKIGVTKYARNKSLEFEWQSRYHDHIIRNQRSYENIQFYIANNPSKWKEDEFY